LEGKFQAAFNAKDINAIMALYTPGDALIVFDAAPPR
jgi:ketosteroid isomerase-like protein